MASTERLGLLVCGVLTSASAFSTGCAAKTTVAVPATAAVVTTSPPVTQPFPVDDESLKGAIASALARDAELHARHLEVAVKNGTVRIAGTVLTLGAKNRAEEITSEFKGADSLVNDVTVRPPPRPDADIERDVGELLKRDPATRGAVLGVTVRAGIVTITGNSDSYLQRRLMADDAARVVGVVQVDERVAPAQPLMRSDAELAADVRDTIADDARLDGAHVTARVVGHAASLSGVVGSLAQRRFAVEDASAPGISTVDAAAIHIDWRETAAARRSTRAPRPSDVRIAAAARRSLSTDPRILPATPTVAAKDGIVVLTGTVLSFAAERAARRDAEIILGVRHVDDDILVNTSEKETDETIQKLAERSIYNDTALPDGPRIRIMTQNGAVTLTGTIRSFREKQFAERDVEEIPGVVALHDDLSIQFAESPPMADQIRTTLVEYLRWDPRVGADRVNVSVGTDGNVVLSGTLDTLGEVRSAEDDAVRAGAAHVVNQLRWAGDEELTPRAAVQR